jgi:hypothetical protein
MFPHPFRPGQLDTAIFGSDRIAGLDSDRKSYLTYVVTLQVATEEEQAEYRGLMRDEALAVWDKHITAIEKREAERREHAIQNIGYHGKVARKLRSLGEFDLAVKREEFIYLLERRVDDPRFLYGSEGTWKGFPPSWGDDILREQERLEREQKMQVGEGQVSA